jgi:hypothetical protein
MSWSSSASDEVERLEKFQRKSAAMETVFTFAILYVGLLQLWKPTGDSFYYAHVPVAVLLILAGQLGWRNLMDQIWPQKDS